MVAFAQHSPIKQRRERRTTPLPRPHGIDTAMNTKQHNNSHDANVRFITGALHGLHTQDTLDALVAEKITELLEMLEKDASRETLDKFLNKYRKEKRGKQFMNCLHRAAFLAWKLESELAEKARLRKGDG